MQSEEKLQHETSITRELYGSSDSMHDGSLSSELFNRMTNVYISWTNPAYDNPPEEQVFLDIKNAVDAEAMVAISRFREWRRREKRRVQNENE